MQDIINPSNDSGVFGPMAMSADTITRQKKGISTKQAVMNLIAGGLGTGMFSLPWSMAGASLLPGIFMTAGVVFINAVTIMILVYAAERKQVFDLGNLLGMLPGRLGKFMQIFSNCMIWVVLLGSLTSYIIVIHDAARPFVLGTLLDNGRLPLVSLASVLVLPLCFLSQRRLSWTSLLATFVNVYLIGLLFALFCYSARNQQLPTDSCVLGFGTGSVAMISNLATCIIIQMCVLPIYEKLQNRTPENFFKVVMLAFTILIVFFSCFAVLGYLLFGPDVAPNALNNLPHSTFSQVAQIGTIFVVAAIYPINVIPMVAPIKKLNPNWFAPPDTPAAAVKRRKKVVTSFVILTIVLVSFIGALFIHDLSLVNVINGAVCVCVFSTMGPAFVGLYLSDRTSFRWKFLMHVLLYFGIILSICGLIFNRNYKEELETSCKWHGGTRHQFYM